MQGFSKREKSLVLILIVSLLLGALLIVSLIRAIMMNKGFVSDYEYSFGRDVMRARGAVFEKKDVAEAVVLKYDMFNFQASMSCLAVESVKVSPFNEHDADSWLYRFVFNPDELNVGGPRIEFLLYDDFLLINGMPFTTSDDIPFSSLIEQFDTLYNRACDYVR